MTFEDQSSAAPKIKKLNMLPANPEKRQEEKAVGPGRFPSWLHRKLPKGSTLAKTGEILNEKRLHTVCEEAKCPNLLECWSKKTATFLILGKECTRNCGFCEIDFSKAPKNADEEEPLRIAESVKELGLKHVVITMVARDDFPDGGARHLANVMRETKRINPEVTIEVLTSDFQGNFDAIECILNEKPEIFNHNIETVRALSPRVRHKATYERSLSILKYVSAKKATEEILVKSGMMLGLGESEQEVKESIQDLKDAGCDIITMGQYLQPSRRKLLVKEFITPEQFKHYEEFGHAIGIKYMYAGPFVRSSYNASVVINKMKTITSL